jgi:hypothetical protein
MGRFLIVLLAATLLAVTPAAAHGRDCGPGTARTVVASPAVRVYFTQRGSTKNYYACWRRTGGRAMELVYGGVDRPDFVNRFLLRGRYLAYVYTSCHPGGACDSFEVGLVDVKRRAVVAWAGVLDGSVRTLVATRGGAAAFLASHGREQYVQKLDSLGVEEIDRGADVHSLTLHGTRLRWLHGMQPRADHVAHVLRCGPTTGATTVLLSRRIRVYYTDPFNDQEELRSYACLLGGGKPVFLGQDDPPSTAYTYYYDFQVRREHVIWLEYGCYMGCVARIHSADLRRRTMRAGSRFHEVPTVFMNERGFAAELLQSESTSGSYSILGFDSTGERLLDDGAGIDPASISVFADAVVWRHDGEQRSAPLR